MKKLLVFVAVIGLSATLGAQSLVELAKKEKARREALKGRTVVTVQNRDVQAVQKSQAVEVLDAGEPAPSEARPVEPAAVTGTTIPEGTQIVPRVDASGPALTGDASIGRPGLSAKVLDAQLRAAQEQVEQLTTRMAALRRQFEAQDAMTPGYVIQQQIVETNESLLKAQAQLDRVRGEINKQKAAGRKRPQTIEH